MQGLSREVSGLTRGDALELDHVFIFSTSNGREADALVEFGLVEAPGRRHAGQGTANRTFHFENGYLEIIWVADHAELTSERVSPTGLWERANYLASGWSPFGLCVVNTLEADPLFRGCVAYQPEYFPDGQVIEIAQSVAPSVFPMLFRLPRGLQGRGRPPAPVHPVGASRISHLEFGVTTKGAIASPFDLLAPKSWVSFTSSQRSTLTLRLDERRQGKTRAFEHLPFTIEY
ncbi:MAG: VOC family protein [Planctomycetota bacterium]